MSDYPNIPMGEDEETTDDAKLHNFYYNAGVDVYLEEQEESRRKKEKVSDELAAENTKKIVSFIQIAVLMCIIWFIYYWTLYNF